jgi:squalene synthase HpnC
MPKPESALRAAYAECRRLARKHYENFPVASYLVPREKRDALAAIYAFARCADDFADEYRVGDAGASQAPRLKRLADWRRRLSECYAGNPDHPVFVALADAAQRFELSREHFENLLHAFESDVRVSRHENFGSLLDYCSYSANPVGRLVLELFTPKDQRDPALFELSDSICTALQLTNFWQDVRVDLARDRVYLPLEDLRRFDLSLEIVKTYMPGGGHEPGENWARFMAFEIERTRELFLLGATLPKRVAPGLRVQLRLTWLGGSEILSKIESAGYDVFSRRPALGRMDRLRLYLRARGRADLASEVASDRAVATTEP